MIATSLATQQTAALDAVSGDLVLRFCGPPRDGQVVRLKSAKCTIGGGPRCTLRLRARGMSGLHCLILRGRGGTVVRRWAPDTRLNQRPFTDSPLAPGDRLGIGPVELEVVSLGDEAADPSPQLATLRQRERWQAEQADAQRRLKEEREALDARQAELESQRDTLAAERRQWELDRAESLLAVAADASSTDGRAPHEVQVQQTSTQAPVDLADVLYRLGAKVETDEDEPETKAPVAKIAQPGDLSEPRPAPAAAPAEGHDDEESVEHYMARLMQRVRSIGAGAELGCSSPALAEPARAERERPEAAWVAAPSRAPQWAPECELADLSPRTVSPEKHVNLSALRELANLSAQSAISHHARRALMGAMRSKLTVALVALSASVGLLWIWKALDRRELTSYAALVTLLVAMYWGVQYAVLTGRLIISKSGHIYWKSAAYGKNRSPSVGPKGEITPLEDAGPPAADVAEKAALVPAANVPAAAGPIAAESS